LSGDGVVNLERTVLGDTQRRAKSVRNAVVHASNGVGTTENVTSSEQSQSRKEDASVVAKSKGDLASVGSLRKAGDSIAVDLIAISDGSLK
jgi:hypothetical protein